MDPMDPKSFGRFLKSAREAMGLTLRAVEKQTDGRIKNAYLSQIEHGAINLPSPATLWELGEVYGISYSELLQRAGHRVPKETVSARDQGVAGLPLKALSSLDEEDRQDLLDFLAYLQQRKK